MALVIRQHINLHRDNPLAATVAGTHYNADLVANLALNDGPQVTADHYRPPLADVYGTLVFHYDNEADIDEAIRHARELGEQLGARSAQAAIKEMKERLKAPWPGPRVIIRLGTDSSRGARGQGPDSTSQRAFQFRHMIGEDAVDS